MLISFRIDWFDFLAAQGTPKSLLQHHNSKTSENLNRWIFKTRHDMKVDFCIKEKMNSLQPFLSPPSCLPDQETLWDWDLHLQWATSKCLRNHSTGSDMTLWGDFFNRLCQQISSGYPLCSRTYSRLLGNSNKQKRQISRFMKHGFLDEEINNKHNKKKCNCILC